MDEKKGYGRRPLWQWILIYLVVGGVIYGIVYYIVFANKGGYNSGNKGYTPPQQQQNFQPQQNTQPNTPKY